MAAAMATMSIVLSAKCASPKITPAAASKASKPALPLTVGRQTSLPSASLTAGAVLAALAATEPAIAAQKIADVAAAAEGGDSRGLALLLPIVPAVGWVLFNILQPALNQLNRMRESKGVVVATAGLGGLAALGMMSAPEAATAAEAAAGGDNRGTLLLLVITPAVLWVLYNILQPALNQLNRMRSD